MQKLRDMLEKELHGITNKGELSAGSLDIIDKLTHSIKSIDTIMAMEGSSNDGYSRGGYSRDRYAYDDGNSYRRRRDSMGRYSNEYSRREDDDRVKDWMRQMEN